MANFYKEMHEAKLFSAHHFLGVARIIATLSALEADHDPNKAMDLDYEYASCLVEARRCLEAARKIRKERL